MISFDNKENKDVLIHEDKIIDINENFEEASKLIIMYDCDKETLKKIKNKNLEQFFKNFLEFKENLTEEKLLENLNQKTGYDFSYREINNT